MCSGTDTTLWEPACWRWLRLNPADTAGCLHRWQASSHNGVWALWEEPACWRWFRLNPADTAGACIAGKPAPTMMYVSGPGSVGASLLAMASAQSCRYSLLPASLASQLPQWFKCQVLALWEPACWRWLRLNPADTAGACIAGKPAPTRVYGVCGSQLAGDGFGSILQIQSVACIAGKPAPTRVYGPVGASLLAMASAQSCRYSWLPASLASQLPQLCMGPVGASLLAMVSV